MHTSVFGHWRDRVPLTVDLSWEEFCDHVLQNAVHPLQVADKTWTPAFSPVEYIAGANRGNENVISASSLVLDYDALTLPKTEEVLEHVQQMRRAVYSTYSHASKQRHRIVLEDAAAALGIDSSNISYSDLCKKFPEDKTKWPTALSPAREPHRAGCVSFRVVLPLSKPVPAAEWPGFWARVQELLPVPSDISCKDAARIYGLPFTAPDDIAESFFERVDEGEVLNVDDVMRLPLPAGSVTPGSGSKLQGDRLDSKHVRALGKKLSGSKSAEKAQIGRWILDIGSGDIWTQEQGQRHASMLLITPEIERHFPTTSIEALTSIWDQSVTKVAGTDPSYDPDARLVDIARAYEGARRFRLEKDAERKAEAADFRKQTIRRVRPDGKEEVYTDEELVELAQLNGCSLEELRRRWIVSCKSAYWILGLDGYEGPYGAGDVTTRARDLLTPAGITVTTINKAGDRILVPLGKLMNDHGVAVRGIVTDMTIARGYLDEDNMLRESVCRLRDIVPKFDPLIDSYLDVAGGRFAGKLKDWLATCLDLSKQTCALYLKGAKGTGKSLIPLMLAQMYRGVDTPTELGAVMDDFNEDLAKCPFVNADEGMPAPKHGKATSTFLRSLIGSNSRSLKRKHVSNASLRGCLRLIIGANNDSLLQFGEDLTSDDLDAINQRFLCISMGQEVADWIAAHGGRKLTESWVAGGFASHVMWLRANRHVTTGDRFLVEGEASEVQAMTATSGDIREGLCQWLAEYLQSPQKADQIIRGLVVIDDEGLWVNNAAPLESWDSYVRHGNAKPTVGRIGRALSGLSTAKRDRDTVRGMKKMRVKFHRINLDLICTWAEANGHGDVAAMRAAVKNHAQFMQRVTN